MDKVRLDKWLWAARFFKTRALAKKAIEGGKIKVNHQKPKASKDIQVNDEMTIHVGWDDKMVIVTALSDQRRGAPEAEALYQETEASINKRQLVAEQRKALAGNMPQTDKRPNKKDRRLIHRFKQKQDINHNSD